MIKNGIKGIIVGAVAYIVSFFVGILLALVGSAGMYALFKKIWPDLPMWD